MSDINDVPQELGEETNAVVKWFNPAKGFGFVQPEDGSPDAFLHVSVLEISGRRDVPDASKIVCTIIQSPKGPQVTSIIDIEPPEPGLAVPTENSDAEICEGTVKFFDEAKGFGFIIPDSGGQDVFVSARALERSGVEAIEPEQRVRMSKRAGQKGPLADSIELI
ncbi:MAG: cold-shock protein [Alphaproteobacteria bacterium]|nr:cold-shock protein [Alphaproteobacteria bacterium]MCZ6765151.1 cold-shock protein [Alphaproteobacteria bacterium]